MNDELKAQLDRIEQKLDIVLRLFADDVDDVEAPNLATFDDPPQEG